MVYRRRPAMERVPLSIDYRVQLETFEGPLDLLLYLIRRAEVDITDIPIAALADQYMEYLAGIDRIDIELAGEFLVTAATLMEIKSRMLTPAAPGPEGGGALGDLEGPGKAGEDPRADLVRQLLAYKRFRDAAEALDIRRHDWERRFPAGRAGTDDASLREALAAQADDLELEDLSLLDLVEAFSGIIASVNFERLGDHTVTYDDTPIELHAEDILDRLKRAADGGSGPIELSTMFVGRTRSEAIGLFLATLELVRRRAIAVRQETPGGRIVLGLRPAESDQGPEAQAAGQE